MCSHSRGREGQPGDLHAAESVSHAILTLGQNGSSSRFLACVVTAEASKKADTKTLQFAHGFVVKRLPRRWSSTNSTVLPRTCSCGSACQHHGKEHETVCFDCTSHNVALAEEADHRAQMIGSGTSENHHRKCILLRLRQESSSTDRHIPK